MSPTVHARHRYLAGGGLAAAGMLTLALLHAPPASATTLSAGFESPDYSVGDLDGQEGWVNNSSGDDHHVVVPSGSEPAAPEGSRFARLTRATGSARAAHELSSAGTLTSPFTVDVLLAHADMSADGAFSGVYVNDTSNLGGSGGNSSGVVFGYVDGANVVGGTAGDVHIVYRDGNDYHSLGLASENAFHRFVVDVDPASASYDIVVKNLGGSVVGSAQDAASRHGEDQFSVLQLAVGSGSQATLFADQVNVLIGTASALGRRYLAIDQTLNGNLTNAEVVLGQAGNAQKMDLVTAPWKVENDVRARPISSVFVDHNGDYRMYYGVVGTHDGDNFATTAVAISSDGYDWTLPALNGSPGLVNHPDANVINLPNHAEMGSNGPGNATVFMDPTGPTSERYKLIWTTGSKFFGAVSADGFNFSTSSLLVEHRNEHVVSAFYDTMKDEYAMYGRIRGASSWNEHGGTIVDDQRRGAAGHFTSGNFLNTWDDAGNTVLDPEDIWDYTDGWTPADPGGNTGIRPDFYNPGVFEYHGQYIGLPATYYRDADRVSHQRPDRFFGTGQLYPTMMHSLDGVNFTLADDSNLYLEYGHPFFDPTANERINPHPDSPFTDPGLSTDPAWDPWTHDDQNIPEVGQIHAAPGFLQVSDEKMLFYYFDRPDTHYLGWGGVLLPGGDSEHSQWVAELRTDGFASVRADDVQPGEWLTTELTVPPDATELHVNADVTGSLKAEVQDPSTGNPVSGLALADSQAFSGDDTDATMAWTSAGIGDVAGQTVQLRFVIDDGEIFSFWFDQ